MTDQVILVNELDEPIGVMDKLDAHRGQAHLHRAISVFLFNKKGNILLQKRSTTKIVGAGQWANTCCGNVRPGESYENCARRRLREELGITEVGLVPVYKFQYFAECNSEFSEREIDQVFVGNYEGEVFVNEAEVNDLSWESVENLRHKVQTDPDSFAPWFKIMLEDHYILTKLPIKEPYGNN